jgi:1-acyl-sn-glycerol-3-phosphate acyltransferase
MSKTIFNISLIRNPLRLLSLVLLKILGWQLQGELPATRKFVMIAAPHTSNWDAFYMIMVSFVFRINLYWMGKHTLFKPPFGFLTRFIGGVPIDRRASLGMVEQSALVLKNASEMVLAVPPEGSRSNVTYWKTGFYYIAHQAGVPIVLGFLDFRRKLTGVGPAILPTGNLTEDIEQIKAFYEPMAGKHSRKTSTIQLQEEQ